MPSLAVVIPVFNEQDVLPELRRRLAAVFDALPDCRFQVLYVNDGSTDASLEIMLGQNRLDPRFAVLDLSRNFGHQSAITAGLAHADADAVVVMDGDLQDPPEVIPELIKCWQGGAQVVLAERRSRAERGLAGLGFRLFYKVFNRLHDLHVPVRSGVFGLLDRRAVAELNRLPEKNRFLPGLRAWIGFEQRAVTYDRQGRGGGRPKQSLRRLLRYALDGVFSFSYKPLRLLTWVGLGISAVGAGLATFYISRRLLGIEHAVTGFTTLVTLLLFLGGVQLMSIGLLGEYLARIYDEVKQRPLYIVRRQYGVRPPADRAGPEA
jgi:dolichol-phosphate mannosyltransferase